MLISVVVPIKNEARNLAAFLDQLAKQTRRPDEEIFIDAASGDQPLEIIRSYSGRVPFPMQIEPAGQSYPGRSRNIGLKAAKGIWIAFMDMGIDFEPKWIERMMKIAENHEADVVLGCCDFSGRTWIQNSICALTYGLGSQHETVPGAIVRKEALIAKKIVFPDNLRAAEDLLWKIEIKKKTKWAKEETPTLHYRSFPDSMGRYLSKRKLYAAHEARAGFHGKYLTLFFGWVLIPLVLLGIGREAYAFIWFMTFFLLRGIADPFRRSSVFQASVLFLTPWLALFGDLSAIKGYLERLFSDRLPGEE